ncbi:hypothetical protein BJX61DRAFT_535833 [Aspergillus egyptiacus]|nr:hypothetical protein BJX61DRAFT_535833 [Aspergillus egyptiacus]
MTSRIRDGSRDREFPVSRPPISDPERAPPPLPLNPGGTPITKGNVSPGIQAVAASFTEKLRENSPSPYTTNPMPPKQSDKSLIKGRFHKRMQSLQNTDSRSEFLNYLESKSPERPLRASTADQSPKQPEKVASRPETPPDQTAEHDPPNVHISNRYLTRPIFGESTPPSATMLALQSMQLPSESEPQAKTRERESSPETKSAQFLSLEALSSQILSLTDIASGLQREMAQLSRRSKDNATDLISLKEATNARDEDIRKSLRDLSTNLASKFLDTDAATRFDISALLGSENGINQTESDSSPNSKKSYSGPRMQSPSPFIAAMEREFCASPGTITDGSASIALLEKVLREMATKEGQEKLLELVNELKARPASENSSKTVDDTVTKMLEEILNIVKQDSESKALVPSRAVIPAPDFSGPARSLDPDHVYAPDMDFIYKACSVERSAAEKDSHITDEILDTLKGIRSSVIEGGGMTNEVKALVRELRGEVLGMGRNLASKLEDFERSRATEDSPKAPGIDEVARIVGDSLHELRAQMDSIMSDKKEHSSATDGADIHSIVNRALDQFAATHLHQNPAGAQMQKEDILEAVREAWETYKPEIELQNYGLERDEILECLTEGLKTYQPQHEQSVTYDQVLAAIQAGIQQFKEPPTITKDEIVKTIQECLENTQSRSINQEQLAAIRDDILQAVTESITSQSTLTRNSFDSGLGRDEILGAVSDGIEAHMLAAKELAQTSQSITKEDVANAVNEAFAAQHSALTTRFQPTISREEIINAISEGLETQNSIPREIELNNEDLMEAITAGLGELTTDANQKLGEEILERLQQQLDGVKEELGQRPSANEGVTEETLNTIKDNIAAVRREVEGYATAASEASGKYEILNTVKEGFRVLQGDLERMIAVVSIANQSPRNPDTPELLDAMEKEFDHLRQTLSSVIRNNAPSDKEEILDAIRDISEGQKPVSSESISKVVQREFERLRESLNMGLVPAEPKSDKDDIIAAVQVALEAFHEERNKASVERSSSDGNISHIIKQELEGIRESITMGLVPAEPKIDKEGIIAAVQATLETFHEQRAKADSDSHKLSKDENTRQIIKQELEALRESLTMGLVPAQPKNDRDEIIAAVQATLEAFHEAKGETKAGGESQPSTVELTETFHDGVGVIREDIAKLLERPTKFDHSELLDALKDGLNGLKAEVEMLRQSRADAVENTSSEGRELVLAKGSTMNGDIEGLKNLISQIQGKVNSIEEAPRAPDLPENLLKKEHVDEILLGLRELQSSVAEILAREPHADNTIAKKEDTQAIESLLRDTRSKLDGMVFPAADELARADQLGSLEGIVNEAKNIITELSGRMDAELPTKADIGTLETLMKDMWIALDESKAEDDEDNDETDAEKLVKADLQTVEAMIFDVKTQVEELKLPDVETFPTKTEIQDLATLMTEFREKAEANHELTGQGFEARKMEHAGLADKIDAAKAVVEGLGEELKSKLDGSQDGLSELKQLLDGLAVSAESFTTVENVKELTELINREFERARGEQDAIKLESEERDAAALVKHDESRAAIVVELGAKIDEKLGEVMAKYDEAQSTIDSKFSEAAERGNEHLETVTSTKSLAEDIKLVISSMGDTLNEACERMSADAKTVIEKVDVSYNKMEEIHGEVKAQKEQARSDVERAAAATERVETKLHEFHPQVLESIQDILSRVGQHYDHSQQTSQELKMDLSVLPSTITKMLPPPEKYDDSQVHEKLNNLLEHNKNDRVPETLNTLIEQVTNNQVHEKLDQLLSQTTSTNGQVYEKLNELLDHATSSKKPIHDKLDTLIDHATNTDQTVTQMMKLDEMHKDIMETSRKMNEMLAVQSALVAEDTERRRKEAEEAAVALERRTAQKEQVEGEIVNLNEEKESLLSMIQRLKSEKDELAAQNAKLNKEVSALETALELRHEEMQVMEERADSLEKRILEGVLEHARTVLLNRPSGTKKVRTSRARNVSTSSTASTVKDARSILGSSIGLALKKRGPPSSQSNSTTAPAAGKERRILSLSHVTGNRGIVDRQSGANGGLANLKRSQSVKSNLSPRKSSWGVKSPVANKENEAFAEEEENQGGVGTGTDTFSKSSQSVSNEAGKGDKSILEEKEGTKVKETEVGLKAGDAEVDMPDAKATVPDSLARQHEGELDEESLKMVLYAPPSDSGIGTEVSSTAG